MKTVLGLSVTSAGVGWVLVDGSAPDALTLDDDAFGIEQLDELEARGLAAVRGAEAIAAASGHEVQSIGVAWTDEVEAQANALIETLKSSGCADVRSVRTQTAAQPEESAQNAAVSVVATAAELSDIAGAAESAETESATETATETDLTDWLTTDFDQDDPELSLDPAGESATTAVVTAFPVVPAADAKLLPAFDAAQAVITNAVPATPTTGHADGTGRKTRTRAVTMAGAAAVAVVIALLAVGSQFVDRDRPGTVDVANRPTVSTPGTSEIVHAVAPPAAPPPVQPLAAIPEPTHAETVPAAPQVSLAIPQSQPSAVVEQPVTPTAVAPLAAPVAQAAPVIPAPVAVAEPVAVAHVPIAAAGPGPAPVPEVPVLAEVAAPVPPAAPAAAPFAPDAPVAAPGAVPPGAGPAPGPQAPPPLPADAPPPPPDPMQATFGPLFVGLP